MTTLPLAIPKPDIFLAAARAARAGAIDRGGLSAETGARTDNLKISLEAFEKQGLITLDPPALTERGEGVYAVLTGAALPAAQGARAVEAIPIGLIDASPLNPRRRFDPERLADLKVSIASKGQLQPGLVRPHPSAPGRYEIAAGERRLRALRAAVEEGLLGPDAVYIAAIKDMTDGELLEAALTENHQRADVNPIEEAEGLQKRREMWEAEGRDLAEFTAAMARIMGCTRAHVAQRLRLVRDLILEGRDAVFDGAITVAQARALCRWPQERQKDALKNVMRGAYRWQTEAEILDQLTAAGIPEKHAWFTREQYGDGPIAAAPSDDDDDAADAGAEAKVLYMDRARAERLQREAVSAHIKALQDSGKWAFVEAEEGPSYHDPLGWGSDFEKCKAADKGAGKLIYLNDSLKVSEYIVRRKPKSAAAGKGRPKKTADGGPVPPRPFSGTVYQQAALAKTAALRGALPVAEDAGQIAMALTTLALLVKLTSYNFEPPEAHKTVKFEPASLSGDARAHRTDGQELAAALADIDPAALDAGAIIKDPAAAFELLRAHPDLPRIFATVVAAWTGAWPPYTGAGPGEAPLTVALAQALGLGHAGAPGADYLQLYGVGQLEAVAFDIGPDAYAAVSLAKGKAGKAAALGLAIEQHEYIPRERRFGEHGEIAKAVDAMLAAPTKAAKKAGGRKAA